MKAFIATYKHYASNYIRFLTQLQVTSITLSDFSQPVCCNDLMQITFDLLVLPGGGDLNPAYYCTLAKDNSECISSSEDALDLLQFQILQLALVQNKPVLGICKGMQLIQIFFGGCLIPDLKTASIHKSTIKDVIHPVSFINPPLDDLSASQQTLIEHLSVISQVNSAHHQGILNPAKGFLAIHISADHVVETMLHRTLPILGFQWHPERFDQLDISFYRDLLHILYNLSL